MKTLSLNLSLIIILFLFSCTSKKKTEEDQDKFKGVTPAQKLVINEFVRLNNKLEEEHPDLSKENFERLRLFENEISELEIHSIIEPKKINLETIIASNQIIQIGNELLKISAPRNWIKVDESGLYSFENLNEYPKKDDYDTPTQFMIEERNGEKIFEIIHSCRNSIVINLLNYEDVNVKLNIPKYKDSSFNEKLEIEIERASYSKELKSTIKDICILLTFPEFVENHDKEVSLVEGLFDKTPMVAVVAILTSIKGRLLQAEEIALNYLVSKIEAPTYKFDKIEPKAFAKNGYYNDSLKILITTNGDTITVIEDK